MAAATPVREWTGLQQFPVATQTALHNILGKLRQQVCLGFLPGGSEWTLFCGSLLLQVERQYALCVPVKLRLLCRVLVECNVGMLSPVVWD